MRSPNVIIGVERQDIYVDNRRHTATSAEQAAADSFASRMVNIMNDAAVALLVSIGHQTL